MTKKTDPAELRVWLAEHADVELPHRYAFWGRFTPEGDAPHQRLLHVDEHILRFAWLLGGVETTTEFELTPEGEMTVLTLRQSHFVFAEASTAAPSGACSRPSGAWPSPTSPPTWRAARCCRGPTSPPPSCAGNW